MALLVGGVERPWQVQSQEARHGHAVEAGAVFCDSGGNFERTWQVRILPSKCRLMAVNVISLWRPEAESWAG